MSSPYPDEETHDLFVARQEKVDRRTTGSETVPENERNKKQHGASCETYPTTGNEQLGASLCTKTHGGRRKGVPSGAWGFGGVPLLKGLSEVRGEKMDGMKTMKNGPMAGS